MILKQTIDRDHPLGWSAAYHDAEQRYRYALVNVMGHRALAARREPRKWAVFITLHPTKQGPTDYARVETFNVKRATLHGFDGAIHLHLCSLVAADPPEVANWGKLGIGPYTDAVLGAVLGKTASFIEDRDDLTVIACWGEYGYMFGRGDEVSDRLLRWGGKVLCFGRLVSGWPKHPMYLPINAPLEPYEGKAP